jgi:hypothetical protein
MTEAPPTIRPLRPDAGSGPQPVPRAPVKPRAKAEPRRPIHLAVAIGLSAGAYAAALAGVTALQSSSEQALVADRAPTADVVDQLRLEHGRLEARMARVSAAYDGAVTAYGKAAGGLGGYEQKLGTLAQQVAIAQTKAAALARAASMASPGSGQAASAPKVSSGGNVTATAAAAAAPIPAAPLPVIAPAPPPAPPPVQATTCASGKTCP